MSSRRKAAGRSLQQQRLGSSRTGSMHPVTVFVIMLGTAIPAFFLGTLTSMHAGLSTMASLQQHEILLRKSNDNTPADSCRCKKDDEKQGFEENEDVEDYNEVRNVLDDSLRKYATGIVKVDKSNFTDYLDLGVPVDPPVSGAEHVLVIYGSEKAHPDEMDATIIGDKSARAALENCDALNIVLQPVSPNKRQCLALVPQYPSYHIQRWMRLTRGATDPEAPLKMYGRGQQDNGRDTFAPPLEKDHRQSWDMLANYLASLDDVLGELREILREIAVKNTVVVMVCNFGQSELLVNFVCAARSRGLDIGNILVFTTDEETTELATSLGLTAYYDKRNFGDIPSEAARSYGDRRFVAMMMAKVICVQLVSMLGYNFLFQDVDIIWYKDPLRYFSQRQFRDFDAIFQDDGGHTVRYAPYSANSGFYYVRHNPRTAHFLTSLLNSGDLVLKTNSHQQALISVMNEHVSLFGLKVKVVSRDTQDLPGGYHFHQRSGKFMRQFFKGEVSPTIFHMSWTKNKDNKLKFLQQMNEWYVHDQCIAKKKEEIDEGDEDLVETCCSAEALFSCHYRDKPSKYPCKDSPPIDDGRRSFW